MSRAPACLVALLASLLLLPGAARGDAPPAPAISAPSAIVLEPSTGEVLYARAADVRRPIASATKLMTALLTLEGAALSDVVPAASYDALPVESQLGLRAAARER